MADYFVNSNAGGGDTGVDWTNAFLTFAQAITAATVDDDRIIVADNHSETFTVNTTYIFGAARIIVICSTVTGSTTVTSTTAANAQFVTNILDNVDIVFQGNTTFLYGIHVEAGKVLRMSAVEAFKCVLTWGTANANAGSAAFSVNVTGITVVLRECTCLNNSTGATNCFVNGNRTNLTVIGGTFASDGTTASHTFMNVTGECTILFDSVDLSGFTKTDLINTTSNELYTIEFLNCFLNVNTTQLADEIPILGSTVRVEGTASNNSYYSQYMNNNLGELFSDTAIVLDATDPASNTVSNKIVTNTSAGAFFKPAIFRLVHGWADFSTSKTVEIEICQDGTTTALKDDEIWMIFEYPDDTTVKMHFEDDKAADNASAVDQASSTAAWTGLSGTNVKQKLSVTTTQTGKSGAYKICVAVAKPSTTVYVNPNPSIV